MIRTCEMIDGAIRKKPEKPGILPAMSPKSLFYLLAVAASICLLSGCGMFNLGKWKGIEKASAGEKYYLVKDVFLSAGSTYNRKEAFDHNMNDTVNLFFTPKMEQNTYTAESVWYDPNGEEFRKIRRTYDLQKESSKGNERSPTGTMRVHSVPTKELYEKKPGVWTVVLYLENDLVRKLTFSLR